jgi:hypothetical protein
MVAADARVISSVAPHGARVRGVGDVDQGTGVQFRDKQRLERVVRGASGPVVGKGR